MGKTPKRNLRCNICKGTFSSFKKNSKDEFSLRSHRNRDETCRKMQEILRREHFANGNSTELNFDQIQDDEENFDDVNNYSEEEEAEDDEDDEEIEEN